MYEKWHFKINIISTIPIFVEGEAVPFVSLPET